MSRREPHGAANRLQTFAWAYLLLILFGAALAASFYWGIVTVQGVPPIARGFDDRQGQARLEALKVALTTTAGLGAAAGLYLSYRRQRTEERNSLRDQDRIFTERFTVAANLLAHESAAVRLAGINSLARLADDSLRDRKTCLSTLCAYLRIPVALKVTSPGETSAAIHCQADWVDSNEWDVRRSALQLVCERLRPTAATDPWRGLVDLRGAVLIEADFSGCRFSGYADFSQAGFATEATFEGVNFESDASFSLASFAGSLIFDDCKSDTLDMSSCTFNGPTSFEDIEIRKKLIFDDARFTEEAVFDLGLGIFPSFVGTHFKAGISVDMSTSRSIGQPDLTLTTNRFDFTRAKFVGPVFIPSGLSCLRGADLRDVEDFSPYDMFNVFASRYPATFDENTRWPPGYDARGWPEVEDSYSGEGDDASES